MHLYFLIIFWVLLPSSKEKDMEKDSQNFNNHFSISTTVAERPLLSRAN